MSIDRGVSLKSEASIYFISYLSRIKVLLGETIKQLL